MCELNDKATYVHQRTLCFNHFHRLAPAMNRTLIVFGILLLVAGLGWPWLKQLPLGRLPGDLHIARASCRLFLPLTTCLLLSVLLSLVLWFIRK